MKREGNADGREGERGESKRGRKCKDKRRRKSLREKVRNVET
jgi:hypothetical protein